jgi:hypothetical protein
MKVEREHWIQLNSDKDLWQSLVNTAVRLRDAEGGIY